MLNPIFLILAFSLVVGFLAFGPASSDPVQEVCGHRLRSCRVLGFMLEGFGFRKDFDQGSIGFCFGDELGSLVPMLPD